MENRALPILDDEVRGRLGRRYGAEIDAWLETVPPALNDLAQRWQIDTFSLVRRGTVSLVMLCRRLEGTPAVLKMSPDRARIVAEAGALAAWQTPSVPELLAVDTAYGALLIEAIRPGIALDESGRSPDPSAVATLLHAVHGHAPAPTSFRPVEERISALFRSGEANYARRPDLYELIPRALYDRGRGAAHALAANASRRVVLHGDLTPTNVLDGGTERGLVAIDPAPCWGDPAFDTVDLLLWQAKDSSTLSTRATQLGELMGCPADRLLGWCAAFAASIALEDAEGGTLGDPPSPRVEMLVDLARSV